MASRGGRFEQVNAEVSSAETDFRVRIEPFTDELRSQNREIATLYEVFALHARLVDLLYTLELAVQGSKRYSGLRDRVRRLITNLERLFPYVRESLRAQEREKRLARDRERRSAQKCRKDFAHRSEDAMIQRRRDGTPIAVPRRTPKRRQSKKRRKKPSDKQGISLAPSADMTKPAEDPRIPIGDGRYLVPLVDSGPGRAPGKGLTPSPSNKYYDRSPSTSVRTVSGGLPTLGKRHS